MKNRHVVAFITVVGGVLFSLLIPLILAGASSLNYQATSGLGTAFLMMSLIPFCFLLGAFIGALVPWFFLKEEKGYDPYNLMGAAFAGAAAGAILVNLGFVFLFGRLSSYLPEGILMILMPLIGQGVPLALAYLGAYWAAGIFCAVPIGFWAKVRRLWLGIVFFMGIFCFLIMVPLRGMLVSDFPENGSMEVRHAWATQRFKDDYRNAVHFVESSSVIRGDVGLQIAAAPAPHSDNYFQQAPGDEGIAVFTLEVRGEKGSGICRQMNVGGVVGERSKMEWRFGGKNIPLKSDGSFDEDRFGLEERIRKEAEFKSRMADLFKRKEYQAVLNEYDAFLHASQGISTTPELKLMLAQSYEAVGHLQDAAWSYYCLSDDEKDGGKKKKYLEKALQLDPNLMSRIKISYKNGYKETVLS